MIELRNNILSVRIDLADLALHVTDLRCGATWSTPGHGFELQVFDIGNQHYRWYTTAKAKLDDRNMFLANPQATCAITVGPRTETTVTLRAQFTRLDLGFDVRFELCGEELVVEIPESGWDLFGEKHTQVISLDCFPMFGGRSAGGEGYMVLPHFGGCLRYFADRADRQARMAKAIRADTPCAYSHFVGDAPPDPKAPQLYAGMTYGQQADWRDLIAYPVWGTIVGQAGYAAYVPFGFGDADAAIVTAVNRGAARHCGVHGRFHYREHSHDTRVDEERRLVFHFFNGADVNYATIGRIYRQYLLDRGGVPTLRQKAVKSPETAYFVGAFRALPMLALKRFGLYNNPNPDGKGILDVYMTTDQLDAEFRRWKKAGIEKVVVQLVGLNYGGHDGDCPTVFPLEPQVGGEAGGRKLVASLKEIGYRTSWHIDWRVNARSSLDFHMDTCMRNRDGGIVYEGTGPNGDSFANCPAAIRSQFVRRNFQRLRDFGIDGGMYTDFMYGVTFRCYDPRHALTRRGYLNAIREYLDDCNKYFGAARVESINACVLDQTDYVSRIVALEVGDALLGGAELTARGMADEAVPLQTVIFHGIICYGSSCLVQGQQDPWAQLLKEAVIGSQPKEEHRGPQPQWDDMHAFAYRTLVRDMEWLQYEFIESIDIDGSLSRTRYSDGTHVWVNRGAQTVTVEGKQLPARSFRVIPGSAGREEMLVTEDPGLWRDIAPPPCPDGSRWPDGRPREDWVGSHEQTAAPTGICIGKDFA
ncbi:MAG TPA: hypothetical protein DCX07_15785 [Phycisphaerales bacterium]|nr:hypothetical protein [Phycisphaerales bacterium]